MKFALVMCCPKKIGSQLLQKVVVSPTCPLRGFVQPDGISVAKQRSPREAPSITPPGGMGITFQSLSVLQEGLCPHSGTASSNYSDTATNNLQILEALPRMQHSRPGHTTSSLQNDLSQRHTKPSKGFNQTGKFIMCFSHWI